MASAFGNFLSGFFGSDGYMRDFRHASRLYRDDNFYDLAPKAGWMYYVRFQIRSELRPYIDSSWAQRFQPFVGLLAKAADLPKFKIATETLNQYNKRTVVQTKLNYEPITITFHDDMANASNDLWRNYYQYHFVDGNYGKITAQKGGTVIPQYGDSTRYNDSGSYAYGLANGQDIRFFSAIEIYLLNKKKYLGFTLVNPIISKWEHDSVSQKSSELLENKMTVEYETVYYTKGKSSGGGGVPLSGPLTGIKQGPLGFNDGEHYDNTPSPLSIAGGGIAGLGGAIGGATEIFGEGGTLDTATSPLDYVKAAYQTANLVKNVSKITAGDLTKEGYSILGGQLSNFGGVNVSNFGTGGLAGKQSSGALANLFRYPNSSVDSTNQATPKNLLGKK